LPSLCDFCASAFQPSMNDSGRILSIYKGSVLARR
jgi:hypothetical protein